MINHHMKSQSFGDNPLGKAKQMMTKDGVEKENKLSEIVSASVTQQNSKRTIKSKFD